MENNNKRQEPEAAAQQRPLRLQEKEKGKQRKAGE